MELRERVILNLWRFRDRAPSAEIEDAADMVIATVFNALQEPSDGVRSIGQKCEAVGGDGGEIYKAMLAAFRTEAMGESQDRVTIAP